MSRKKQRRNKTKFEIIVARYFAISSWFLILLVSSVIYWRYTVSSNTYNEELMLTTANIAMESIDAEIHSKIGVTEGEESQSYRIIQNQLLNILNSSENFSAVYTWRYDEDGNLRFIVDAQPDEGSQLGEIYPESVPILEQNYSELSAPVIEENFTIDQWGIVKSIYAPIITSNGKVDGVIGIDMDQSVFQIDRVSFLEIIGIVLLGSIFISSIFSRVVSTTVMKPFRDFIQEVKKSIDSNFEYEIPESGNEFIISLAQSFNRASLQARKNNKNIQDEVESRTSQLEKLTEQMVGRELKMRELKEEISQLRKKKDV